jgi:hypothetical protein
MLVINQRLDKLAAMHTDFVAHGMLPAGHPPWRNLSTDPTLKLVTPDNNDDDDRAPVKENVMGHVVTSLSYLGTARLLVLMSRLYLYYRLAYSHLPDLPRT